MQARLSSMLFPVKGHRFRHLVSFFPAVVLVIGCEAILGLDRTTLGDPFGDASTGDVASKTDTSPTDATDGAVDDGNAEARFRVFLNAAPPGSFGSGYRIAANVACTSAAQQITGGVSGRRWVAWLSESGGPMSAAFKQKDVPRFLVDRQTLVFSGSPTESSPKHAIDTSALGAATGSFTVDGGQYDFYVVTGTLANGQVASNCDDWTSRDASTTTMVGSFRSLDAGWTASNEQPCHTSLGYFIYCFEDTF